MKIVRNYRDNAELRRSFNELAIKTFGLDFEDWYQNGFWGENYEPFSVVEDGRIVANVSLNRTDLKNGERVYRLWQIGTVMTDEAYRNRGYIREIMKEVDKVVGKDPVYLFANDSVVDFYPKFGFVPAREYIWMGRVVNSGENRYKNIPMNNHEDWNKLSRAMEENRFPTACEIIGNPELTFFYVSKFMQDCVYYCEDIDTWVIAEIEDGELMLHNVYSPTETDLHKVIEAFGKDIKFVKLGFSPADTTGLFMEEYHEEDCNFFTRGDIIRLLFDVKHLRIPTLAHA